MKPATIQEIKNELAGRSQKDLREFCTRLARFKKDNKELLTYLLFEAFDEPNYIRGVKEDIDQQFRQINKSNFYYIRKSVRKIHSTVRKYIRYSQKKETEVELLIHFCRKLKEMRPSFRNNMVLTRLYDRQIETIGKLLSGLHEDLQMDFEEEVKELLY